MVDGKRHVAHAQARVTTLLNVARWTAKPADEKVSQPLLGAFQVMLGIHRSEHVVPRHLRVKRPNQPRKPVFANACVDLLFAQIHNSSMTDEAPKSAYELAMQRLKRKDAEAGVEERQLTDEQKAEIAEIKRVYAARMAEAEIFHRSKVVATFDPQERAVLDENHRRDLERLRDEQERKLAKFRD